MRRVLLVDDDDSMGQLLVAVLKRRQFEAVFVSSPDEALAVLEQGDFDVVVTDLKMRGMDGIALCERIVASRPELPVILLTAFGTFDAAVGAIRAGAYDFVTKPVENEVLLLAVERAWRHRTLRDEVKRLRLAVEQGRSLDDIVGASAVMKKVYDLVDRVAQSEASVLITGESGTGKEMVAHAIHRRSARGQAPFVAINCAGFAGSAAPQAEPAIARIGIAAASQTFLFIGVPLMDDDSRIPAGPRTPLSVDPRACSAFHGGSPADEGACSNRRARASRVARAFVPENRVESRTVPMAWGAEIAVAFRLVSQNGAGQLAVTE